MSIPDPHLLMLALQRIAEIEDRPEGLHIGHAAWACQVAQAALKDDAVEDLDAYVCSCGKTFCRSCYKRHLARGGDKR